MDSEADSRAGDPCSFPRTGDPLFSYCEASRKKQGGRNRRTKKEKRKIKSACNFVGLENNKLN